MNCCESVEKFWRNGVQYTKAVYKWIKYNRPVRTAKEIQVRFKICQQCEFFEQIPNKPWRGRCKVCGCYLGRHKNRFIIGNKIAMRTEQCPKKKWS